MKSIVTSKGTDQIHDPAADLRVLDAHKCLVQGQALGGGEEVHHIGCRLRLAEAISLLRRPWSIFKEEGYRDFQDGRDVLETARPYAVRAFFIFLNLLKGDSEAFTKLLLAHAKHHSAQPHTAADMNVNGIRSFLAGHLSFSFFLFHGPKTNDPELAAQPPFHFLRNFDLSASPAYPHPQIPHSAPTNFREPKSCSIGFMQGPRR